MKYLEFSFRIDEMLVDETLEWLRDLLVYHLGEIGFDSFSSDDQHLLAYIQEKDYLPDALRSVITAEIISEHMISFSYRKLEDKNWNEEWEQNYFKPLTIDDVTIRASFHPQSDTPMEIIIDPKMAFGTGNHATTASMLRLIKQVDPRGLVVTDMGCGSGILGIYAMKLGAKSCTAIDFDEWSVQNAIDNAELNEVELTVLHGDAAILPSTPQADLFMANINRNIILNDLDAYIKQFASNAILLLSGFYQEDLELIEPALNERGLSIVKVLEQDRWVGVMAHRGE